MPRLFQSLKIVLIAAGLIAAISLEMRIALSAQLVRKSSVDALLHAARLTPTDEDIYLRLADLDPVNRSRYLHRASQANPHDARPWLNQGFIAEVNNDLSEAEHDFHEAARLDRRTAPAWALANFYFRQNNTPAFLFWAHQYRAFAGGDVAGLYRLAWTREPHVATILGDFSPMTCQELEGLAGFLDTRSDPSENVPVDRILTSCADKEALSIVMSDVSRLLMADHPDIALLLWNNINRKDPLDQAYLNPDAGRILTNATFANQLDGIGFNWRINGTPGVHVRRLAERHSIEFSFDGSEPEVSTLLFEPVVLVAETSYQINCKVHSEDELESGFSWRVVELSTGKTLESGLGNASNRQNDSLSWTFQAPASSRTLVLAFTYVRPAGETRKDGTVMLSNIRLSPVGTQARLVKAAEAPGTLH